MKVKIHNPILWDKYLKSATLLISVLSLILLFVNSPEYRLYTLIIFVIILISLFLIMWVVANGKKHLKMNIMGSDVEICQGDIFKCDDEQKVIAFNEFFDTDVDDYLVMKRSVNGRYISKYFDNNIDILDKIIENYPNSSTRITEQNVVRISGKRLCSFFKILLLNQPRENHFCSFFNTKHYKPAPKSPPNKTRLVGYRLNIHGANSYTMNGSAHSLLQKIGEQNRLI